MATQGYITEPGRFEGEFGWVKDAHEDSLDGHWDNFQTDATGAIIFDYSDCDSDSSETWVYREINDNDRNRWGFNADIVAVALYNTLQGFIFGHALNQSGYEELLGIVNQ